VFLKTEFLASVSVTFFKIAFGLLPSDLTWYRFALTIRAVFDVIDQSRSVSLLQKCNRCKIELVAKPDVGEKLSWKSIANHWMQASRPFKDGLCNRK